MPSASFIANSENSGSHENPDVQLSILQFVVHEVNLRPSLISKLNA